MTFVTCSKVPRKWLKYLSFLVLLTTLCYPAYVCAHPQPEPLAATGATPAENKAEITIELAEVAELDKVARFTQLLAKSTHISDLRLSKVQLDADQPEYSFVRWSARMTSGTPDDLEHDLLFAADASDGLKIVHRQSSRGFVAFALNTVSPSDNVEGGLLPQVRRSPWSTHSGHGFD